MSLDEKRNKVRELLHELSPADASAAYYAFHHPADKTQLSVALNPEGQPLGYVCASRTGIDLFRPLLTMRLPISPHGSQVDPVQSAVLLHSAIAPGTAAIVSVPQSYRPIITALFDVQSEQELQIMVLDQARYKPVVNVLVTESETYNGLPRFVVRARDKTGTTDSPEIAASAGLNWRSPDFAEVYVHTKPTHRRRGFGRSVVAAVVQKTLDDGRTPLYAVGVDNQASIQLAESVGFVNTGLVDLLFEATLSPRLV